MVAVAVDPANVGSDMTDVASDVANAEPVSGGCTRPLLVGLVMGIVGVVTASMVCVRVDPALTMLDTMSASSAVTLRKKD